MAEEKQKRYLAFRDETLLKNQGEEKSDQVLVVGKDGNITTAPADTISGYDSLPIGAQILQDESQPIPIGWKEIPETYEAKEVFLESGISVEDALKNGGGSIGGNNIGDASIVKNKLIISSVDKENVFDNTLCFTSDYIYQNANEITLSLLGEKILFLTGSFASYCLTVISPKFNKVDNIITLAKIENLKSPLLFFNNDKYLIGSATIHNDGYNGKASFSGEVFLKKSGITGQLLIAMQLDHELTDDEINTLNNGEIYCLHIYFNALILLNDSTNDDKNEITVMNIWDDKGIGCPNSTTAVLSQDGEVYTEMRLQESNNYLHTWSDLPYEHFYSVKQKKDPSKFTSKTVTSDNRNFIIINSAENSSDDYRNYVKVNAFFKNEYGASIPDSVSVNLYCDGLLYDTIQLDSTNNWTYEWKKLEEGHIWTLDHRTMFPNSYVDNYNYHIYNYSPIFAIVYNDLPPLPEPPPLEPEPPEE